MNRRKTVYTSSNLDQINFPSIVYKYRDWDQDYHDKTIKERQIFLASPSTFEDTRDNRNPIRYDLLTEDEARKFFEKLLKKKNPKINLKKCTEEANKLVESGRLKDPSFMQEFNEKFFTEFFQRYGVLSLTAKPCLSDMWDKYANKGKGFCIGYDSKLMFEFLGGGGPVTYHNELPILKPLLFMSQHEIDSGRIYAKEMKWKFEQEYRTHKFWNKLPDLNDRQITLPKEAFKKVILGENISSKSRNEIITAVKESIGEIPILEKKQFCEKNVPNERHTN